MRRLHLWELEDFAWWPSQFRDYQTDFLRQFFELGGFYRESVPVLRSLLQNRESRQLVDLCSGAGGPWEQLISSLPKDTKVTLTDLYPNQEASRMLENHPQIQYHPQPIDARFVPSELSGVRSLFTAIHHFEPEQVKGIFEDAQVRSEGLVVFEVVQRRWPNILLSLLVGVAVLLLTPWIRPFSWSRVFWTYFVPIIPVSTAWDGFVSHLRAYRPEELLTLAQESGERFDWKVEEIPTLPLQKLTCLVGEPRKSLAIQHSDASNR